MGFHTAWTPSRTLGLSTSPSRCSRRYAADEPCQPSKSRRHWRAAARRVQKSNVMKCTQPRQPKLTSHSARRKSKFVVPMQEQKLCCWAATEEHPGPQEAPRRSWLESGAPSRGMSGTAGRPFDGSVSAASVARSWLATQWAGMSASGGIAEVLLRGRQVRR